MWLTTLPIAEHGFALSKGEFHYPLCLRFGWQPVYLPQTCFCGKPFCVEHAFTCTCGGFPSIRHNEARDLTASLLSEACSDVGVKPALQPLDGEPLQFTTANTAIVKMVPVLMLLPGIFGVEIGSMRFSISGFSILLRALIFAPNCPDVTSFMNVKNYGHMMSVLERLRELAFHRWCLQLLVAWGPLLQQLLGSLLQC